MLVLIEKNVTVRCIECREQSALPINMTGVQRQQRSMGFEREMTYVGNSVCRCGEKLALELLVYEYPKGQLNHIEDKTMGCILFDKPTQESFTEKDEQEGESFLLHN